MKKKVYALVKALKSIRDYIMKTKIIVFVSNIIVKHITGEQDYDGNRGKWIEKHTNMTLILSPESLSRDTD
jgi:hypothetical protein